MRKLILVVFLIVSSSLQASSIAMDEATWYERNTDEQTTTLHLHFYWSKKCPHCLRALPYIEDLALQRDDIEVHSYQLVGNEDNVTRYQVMASSLGMEARSVPAFFLCNTMLTGFDEAITPGQIESILDRCQAHLAENNSLDGFVGIEEGPMVLELPFIGAVQAGDDSLPMMTLIIAGVDAFNPCAFFVLMFLLSLLIHTRSRKRMLLVAGVFVFFSGLLYFLFMTAWLNLFRVIGHLDAITIAAAVVAVVIGLLNIKDFFWFRHGVSLTISDSVKPKLFERMRGLLQARSLPTLLVATTGLALFANMYEFLCTAGFPMVYTRILTLSGLTTAQYYAYLVFYNLIYIVPLIIIVLLFVVTMSVRKLQQGEGRGLKLFSGTMMLALGMILLLVPTLLQNLVVTLSIVLGAIVVSVVLILAEKYLFKQS
jgi:glutaredoxin